MAAYGLILPKAVLSIPRYGCLNIHASLFAALARCGTYSSAINAGDKVTGITIMQMDEKVFDTGDMILKHQYTLAENETSQSLHDRLAKMGAKRLLKR